MDTTGDKYGRDGRLAERRFPRVRPQSIQLTRPPSYPIAPAMAPAPRTYKIARGGVFGGAVVITLALVFYGPGWMGGLTTLIFGPTANMPPAWVSHTLLSFYIFFVLTAGFPYLLTLGWAALAGWTAAGNGDVPLVSLVIPAFNEERHIHRTLQALRQLDYPAYEVIVVNDGSTDFTFSFIERAFVKCIQLRRNQGKAAALNAGIARAKGDIVVFSDSDSWLHPMALRYLVQGFSDPSVGAVSGTVEIVRPKSLLKCWQTIEYTYGQFLVKTAQMGSGSTVAICPGPVCAYRRDLLITMGGFKGRTITEDFDATLDIIKQGHRVVYAPRAVAYTDAPDTWRALKRQRLRWFRGHLQVFRIHRDLMGSLKAGALSWYWLPVYYLFLGYGSGMFEVIALPALPVLVVASGNPLGMLQITVLYLLFAELFVMSAYIIALARARIINKRLIAAGLIIYPYLYYLQWVRLVAMVNEIRGKQSTWSG